MDKSELMIVSILAIWKAGAAFVPIAPAYPDDRVRFILNDTRAVAVLTNTSYKSRLSMLYPSRNIFAIDNLKPLSSTSLPQDNVSALAYVTYTSGTTGQPKGVLKEHKNVINSIVDLSARYKMQEGSERIALFSEYVFEPFLRQMLMALVNSQTLVIVPHQDKYDPIKFSSFLQKSGITYLNGTASLLQQYNYSECPALSKILCAGEELTQHCYNKIRKTFTGTIIDEYGPTESAFVTTGKFFPAGSERLDRSIGKPLNNVKCYVLDEQLQSVKVGEIGELYIGGAGVSPGYLQLPDLTAQRFLKNPFQTEQEKIYGHNARMYKTGDLARWLSNGELEFLGRNDNQVKIHGIRIEPGEIEAHLSEFPGVTQSVVVAKDIGAVKSLVGYFVGDAEENAILGYLTTKLPRYMIPHRVVRIAQIPITTNGKLDVRSLPDVSNDYSTEKFPPCNHWEKEILDIFATVLNIPFDHLSATDDFLCVGGDSVQAIHVIGQVRKRLSRVLTVEDIFALRTAQNLASHLQRNAIVNDDNLLPLNNEKADEKTGIMPANGLQQGLFYRYLKQYESDDAYTMQNVCQYRSSIQPDYMHNAWIHTQRKYPALRLRFEVVDQRVLQIVDDSQALDYRFVDVSNEGKFDAHEKQIKDLLHRDRAEKYYLEKGNLFRIYLIKRNDELFTLVFSCHHIIVDGWSIAVIFRCLHEFYTRMIQSNSDQVTFEPDCTYAVAQRYLHAYRKEHEGYWQQQTAQISERCDLNGILKEKHKYKVVMASYDHIEEQLEQSVIISGDDCARLKRFCSQNGVTLHSVLQFTWHKVLSVYGGSRQTVVGTTVSGRNIPIDGIESAVGLFINTLPLVVNHENHSHQSVIECIRSIQMQISAMNDRSNVELLHVNTGALKHGLFDSLFVLENYASGPSSGSDPHRDRMGFQEQLTVEKLDHPLAILAKEMGQSIKITLLFAGDLFSKTAVLQLLDVFAKLLNQINENPEQNSSTLDYVPSSQQLLFDAWNDTESQFPREKTLHNVFEDMAARNPDKTAIVYEDRRLTYKETNERANQVAHHLCSLINIPPDMLIALVLDKSELMILSVLGVWKSGAAYVPIDPNYPDHRIQFILQDTSAKLLITNQRHVARFQLLAGKDILILPIESVLKGAACLWHNVGPTSSSTDLAYVIYTSGTTGKPKGVMVEHMGVVNLQLSLSKVFKLQQQEEVFLSFSNYVFDHFVEQMTDALLNGQTLVVLNDEMRTDKARLYEYIQRNKVTYLSGTPSVLQMYEYDRFEHSLTRIDAVGEDFSEPVFNKIRKGFKGLIINGYGPTEISITSHKRLYPVHEKRTNKSIGFPVANTKCYVLNYDMQCAPVGGVGELYIGGVGVARGYLNRPKLTADRFRPNPFQTEKERLEGTNGRIYKTGDLVRWLPNGELEYLGRNDMQVKMRGLRIEISEIETAMISYPGVKRAVVTTKEYTSAANTETRKYLIGYYMSNAYIAEHEMKKFLQISLPEYMVPHRLMRIDEIPITVNGKLDAKNLPDIDCSSHQAIAVPTTPVQTKLRDIWSEVLGLAVDAIGIHDDFFGLGGDSLSVQRLFFEIAKAFSESRIDIASIFRHRTIEALSSCILASGSAAQPLVSSHKENVPVSLAQEQLLFIQDYENGTSAYNVSLSIRIPSSVNRSNLKRALISLIVRQQALRTIFQRSKLDGSYEQHIMADNTIDEIFMIDERFVDKLETLDDELHNASLHVFKLNEELPIKVTVFDVADDKQFLVLNILVHHACFDEWSWKIFQQDLHSYYTFYQNNQTSVIPVPNLPDLTIQYNDYAVGQRQFLSQQKLGDLRAFWMKHLDGFESLRLPTDFLRPSHIEYAGENVGFELDQQTTELLKNLAKQLRVSLFAILFSTYAFLLSNYANQDDVVIGTPVANRDRVELENLIGFFVNMIPLRTHVNLQTRIVEYIETVSAQMIKCHSHKDLPFRSLVKGLNLDRDPSRHPVFQVVFSLNHFASTDEPETDHYTGDFKMYPYEPQTQFNVVAKYDITTTMSERGAVLTGQMNFATSLFSPTTITSMVDCYVCILKQIAKLNVADDRKLASLHLVNEDDHALDDSSTSLRNSQPVHMPLVHQLFEQETERSPASVAVVCGDTRLTYQTLNERSNQLAHYLQSTFSIRPDTLVALLLDRSETTIITILAVWKSGAAYVPIDPSYPDERVRLILKDAGTHIIIANHHYINRIQDFVGSTVTTIGIDSPGFVSVLNEQPLHNCESFADAENLAYVIYTSGTTGTPNGVLVPHKTVVGFRNSLIDRYFVKDQPHLHGVLLLSNYVFDLSIEQMALSVLSGNKLIVVANNIAIDDDFYACLNENRLTYLSGAPTYLQQIDLSRIPGLQMVTVAGEAFTAIQFEKIRREYKGILNNAYGITETTVYNMICTYQANDVCLNSLGSVLSNTKCFVLNDSLQPLPQGAVGQLYLSGDCVTRGYLNRQQLTSERYLPNIFQTTAEKQLGVHTVMYKSGDLVRCAMDGTLEYFGRTDTQIKIRGLRVELGEIEAALAEYPKVKQCVVLPKGRHGNPYLVGYVVTKENFLLEETKILSHLGKKLPSYMVPARIIQIKDEIPVTINGKLDTNALPDVDAVLVQKLYAPPRNHLERQFCQIWMDLLGVPHIGIDDDYFRLGGDSITSLKLIGRMRQQTKTSVSLKDIFRFRTIREITDNAVLPNRMQPAEDVLNTASEQGILRGTVPLLPIQKWFFDKKLDNRNHWNQSFTIRTPPLNLSRLEEAVEKLIEHHDAFRLRFRKEGDKITQNYDLKPEKVPIKVLSVENSPNPENILRLQNEFDISSGPIFSIGYLHGYIDGSARVWFAMHRLIADTVSWRIISDDLKILYDGGNLGHKLTSYRQWSKAIEDYAKNAEAEQTLWRNLYSEAELYNKRILAPLAAREKAYRTTICLSKTETERLLRREGNLNTLEIRDLLLTALAYALQSATKEKTNYVTLQGHGREPWNDMNVSRTVGWFTVMYPVALHVRDSLKKTLLRVSEYLHKVIPNKGLGYGSLIGYNSTLPKICFNYLGRFSNHKEADWTLTEMTSDYGNDPSADSNFANDDIIEISGLCANDEIRFTINSRLDSEITECLASSFRETLQQLINLDTNAMTEFEPYIDLSGNQNAPVIFFFPPLEGGAESYLNNLAPELKAFNLILFNNYYMYRSKTDTTFEELSKFYIGYVKQLQPYGPYNLLGWSFGGTLALEVARQLAQNGDRIDNLMFIDSYFDVRAAGCSIGYPDKYILDSIYYRCTRDRTDFRNLMGNVRNIILFRANRLSNMFTTEEERLLDAHYMQTEYNHLDTLLDAELVQLVHMDDSHHSWVHNRETVSRMGQRIRSIWNDCDIVAV
ncbi:N-(5-amino-5-carboxypentanoyl)-L-cysteinyl-D-valine synthase-like [Paramacrobiotus metropolitanus]|uniref:N-(5-amino-5-carboxypentanoyl)-L-cysteinyl-D- valine synthase-like n=1 Tax=Paramacrobiotus metropolitanus TaxID=2943436 RepID=UPI0024462435|nr:N-(5-amino-5-carboxypentanoyl)-L-cysteinyl-D-valine synthase-like [Paramacrobiotus metropolitanus]